MRRNDRLQPLLLGLAKTLLLLLGLLIVYHAPAHTLPPEGLRREAPSDFRVGVSVHTPWLAEEPYARRVQHDFNTISPEVTLKYEWIHPCPPAWLLAENPSVVAWVATISGGAEDPSGHRNCRADPSEWNWGPMDGTVRWANEHDIGLFMLPLVWHMQNPGWLTHPSVALSPAQLERLMVEHIDGIIAHYCAVDEGSIYAYNVVNEAIAPDGSLYPGGPWPAIGADYVYKAFLATRNALDRYCPGRDIKLFYNDHDYEFGPFTYDAVGNPTSWAAGIYKLIESLNAGERPLVDGLGMQAHLRLYQFGMPPGPYHFSERWDEAQLTETMNSFSRGLDIEVQITELDVALRRWRDQCPADAPRPPFSSGDCAITDFDRDALFDEQAERFASVLRACLRADRCTGLQLWGLSDERSWLRDFRPVLFEPCHPNPVTSLLAAQPTYCPKPAYWAVREVLREWEQ